MRENHLDERIHHIENILKRQQLYRSVDNLKLDNISNKLIALAKYLGVEFDEIPATPKQLIAIKRKKDTNEEQPTEEK